MLPMADDRSHNNDNDKPDHACHPPTQSPSARFFRLQNDLMAAHPLQVAMQAVAAVERSVLTIHPTGSALFALLLDAANGLLSRPGLAWPVPGVHNIIFHIVRSLACHFFALCDSLPH